MPQVQIPHTSSVDGQGQAKTIDLGCSTLGPVESPTRPKVATHYMISRRPSQQYLRNWTVFLKSHILPGQYYRWVATAGSRRRPPHLYAKRKHDRSTAVSDKRRVVTLLDIPLREFLPMIAFFWFLPASCSVLTRPGPISRSLGSGLGSRWGLTRALAAPLF